MNALKMFIVHKCTGSFTPERLLHANATTANSTVDGSMSRQACKLQEMQLPHSRAAACLHLLGIVRSSLASLSALESICCNTARQGPTHG